MTKIFSYFATLPKPTSARSLALWLTVIFAFVVPWENAVHIGAIGRIGKLVGIVAFIIWALGVIARGRLRQPDAFQKVLFLFLIWNGATLYWSFDSDATFRGFITYTELFGLALMLWDLYDRQTFVNAALQAYVMGAYIASGSVIFNYLTAPEPQFPAHERISALGFQTDGIALVIAIAAPAAWYLAASPAAQQHGALARSVNYGYIPIGLLALAMTGTRGASLASIPTAAFVLWSLRRSGRGKRAMSLAALAVATLTVVQFAPQGPLERIGTATTVTEVEEGALSGRWGIWMESLNVFGERPITGVGLDAHREAVAPALDERSAFKKARKEAHNTYVSVLAETGLVGFVLFATVASSLLDRVRLRSGWELAYWSAQLGVLAIGAMSLSLEDSKSIWIMTSLAVASAAAARSDHGSSASQALAIGERRVPVNANLAPRID